MAEAENKQVIQRAFDASAIARDGLPYANTYTWYLRMSDDAVVDVVAFFDSIEFNDFWARVEPG